MVGGGLARLLANVIVMGTGVVGRAFMEAYKQALANGGMAAASAGRTASKSAALEQEARLILNVKQKASQDEIAEAHKKLASMNDVDKGGSDYLNAKLTFARDMLLKTPDKGRGTAAEGSEGSAQAKSDGK
uniref:Mitochondrial import inner membrane translocase subunit TIM16 n=1 Tax=Calcidiscus leptoporus TaxID=127549 RepID=A0A7S0J983_9EUKA|mmetsp:Transcript_45744/g.106725  ORF Transcript_45744/g.106725 Transcript_45744/m.106725 type:complete len:131 (+) Transcript_45744:20-412(+)